MAEDIDLEDAAFLAIINALTDAIIIKQIAAEVNSIPPNERAIARAVADDVISRCTGTRGGE